MDGANNEQAMMCDVSDRDLKLEDVASTHDSQSYSDTVPRSPPSPCELPASCQIASFDALVVSSHNGSIFPLTDAWTERMRNLTARDCLTVHKQWMQRSSLWVVRAEEEGPASPAMGRLTELNGAYNNFVERAMTLAPPHIWAQRSSLDAEVSVFLIEIVIGMLSWTGQGVLGICQSPKHQALDALQINLPI